MMDVTGGDVFPDLALAGTDCLIAVCGYERRSLQVPKQVAGLPLRRFAIDFETGDVAHYEHNRLALQQEGFAFITASSDDLVGSIRSAVLSSDRAVGGDAPKVLVDVSSMSRSVLAQTIEALIDDEAPATEAVYFIYNSSAYSEPPAAMVDVLTSRPASPYFAGSLDDTSRPIALIMGLSYEPGRALACMDQFEAVNVFAFRPHGPDVRFQADIDASNKTFIELVGDDRIVNYDVHNPMALYNDLRSLVLGLTVSHRVVVVPFGPKIFSAAAMLIALDSPRSVSIWRVSGDSFEHQLDREPTDLFAYFRVQREGGGTGSEKLSTIDR